MKATFSTGDLVCLQNLTQPIMLERMKTEETKRQAKTQDDKAE